MIPNFGALHEEQKNERHAQDAIIMLQYPKSVRLPMPIPYPINTFSYTMSIPTKATNAAKAEPFMTASLFGASLLLFEEG